MTRWFCWSTAVVDITIDSQLSGLCLIRALVCMFGMLRLIEWIVGHPKKLQNHHPKTANKIPQNLQWCAGPRPAPLSLLRGVLPWLLLGFGYHPSGFLHSSRADFLDRDVGPVVVCRSGDFSETKKDFRIAQKRQCGWMMETWQYLNLFNN